MAQNNVFKRHFLCIQKIFTDIEKTTPKFLCGRLIFSYTENFHLEEVMLTLFFPVGVKKFYIQRIWQK